MSLIVVSGLAESTGHLPGGSLSSGVCTIKAAPGVVAHRIRRQDNAKTAET